MTQGVPGSFTFAKKPHGLGTGIPWVNAEKRSCVQSHRNSEFQHVINLSQVYITK